MAIRDNNAVFGIPPNAPFQVGVTNVDQSAPPIEEGIGLPIAVGDSASWLYYECHVECHLDSGLVVHNVLPQYNRRNGNTFPYDSLASANLADPYLDTTEGGVNITSGDQYTDVIQYMGHARYWFRLWGRAMRFGQQIPIPGLISIGGALAIPHDKNPQWAHNSIVPGGNFSGTIMWRAEWDLWYTTAAPPNNNYIPATDPAAHISNLVPPSDSTIQAPYSQPDDDAVVFGPPGVPQ